MNFPPIALSLRDYHNNQKNIPSQEPALTTDKRGFILSVWDFFCSLKLSISLLIGLAVTSIIGTVIPQSPPREYLESISQTKIAIYSKLGFFNMYHSWWFLLLLCLLTLNLIYFHTRGSLFMEQQRR